MSEQNKPKSAIKAKKCLPDAQKTKQSKASGTKIEQKTKQSKASGTKIEKKIREIVSIKDVPPDELFRKNSIWSATNLKTKIEFELSGFNVGLYLAASEPLRQLLLSGHIDSFTRDGLYIKFLKCEIEEIKL